MLFFKFPILFYSNSQRAVYYNVKDKEVVSEDIGSLKKVYQFTTTIYIGLNEEGKLMNICTRTGLVSHINIDTLFDDFLLISDKNKTYFLTVAKKNELGSSNVQLMLYPERSIVFSINVTEIIHFITPEDVNDEIMYIAKITSRGYIKELRFQTVSETVPEKRLQRLLRRQKFDEAEQFAILFNLDLAEIKKAKAQILIDKLVCTKEDITNFLSFLDVLEDDAFKIRSCLEIHMSCSSLKDVEKVLKYANSIPLSTTSENLQNIQDSASRLWLRFHTFMMLVRENTSRSTVESWVVFYNCNLISELHELLEDGEIEQWRIIYSRLDDTTLEQFCQEDILKTLEIISKFSLEDQISFLNTFIPITLNFFPSTVQLFIDWMILKVDYIEQSYFENFPENALHFLNKLIKLLKIKAHDKLVFYQKTGINASSLKEVENLIATLEKVKSLKDDHGILLPFQQMLQGTESLVRTLLGILDYGLQNEKFFEDFIDQFILKSTLKPDELFRDIINIIVNYEEKCWIQFVLLILKYINSTSKKLEATIVILQAAEMPWCKVIRDIALSSLKYSHPLVETISTCIEEESKTVVFKKEPYNIKWRADNSFLERAINRIIYCNQQTMIQDIYQVCKNPKEKALADILLISHFIVIGDFSKTLELLENNSDEDMIKCSRKIIQIMITHLNQQEWNVLENYFQIIGSVLMKFKSASSFIELGYRNTISNIRCLYYIHKTFNINFKLHDFDKEIILRRVVSAIVKEFKEDNDSVKCITRCDALAFHLQIEKDRVLLKLCKDIADFNVILNAANCIYESTNDSKVLCKTATIMLRHIGSSDVNLDNFGIQSFCDYHNFDVQPFVLGLKLNRKIVAKAILNAPTVNLAECLELGNWMEATYFLVQPKARSSVVEDFHIKDAVLLTTSVFNAIRSSFNFCINFSDQPGFRNTDGNLSNSIILVEDSISTEMRNLQSTMTSLASEGNVLIAYKLIVTLYTSLRLLSSKTVRSYLGSCVKHFAEQLIKYIFSSPSIDVNLTTSLLIICDDLPNLKKFLLQSLKRYKRNLYKFEKIAETCLLYLKYNDVKDGQLLCTNILCLSTWWKRLKSCHITYEEFFRHPPNKIIVKLIKFNDLSIEMIHELSSNINGNVQDYYKIHLEALLLNWKPKYTLTTNRYGKESIIMNHNEEEYVEECMNVIELIDDRQTVFCLLDSIWEKINFYHYEVFMCVLDILLLLNPNKSGKQKKTLLTFLTNYNRVGEPGEAETEQWLTLYPATRSIDSLSKWRLPFTPTLMCKEIWSIIRPEINLKTYKKWFDATSALKHLNINDICSYVIKDVVSSGILRSEKTDQWLINARHEELLHEIDVCVANISNLEQATSALYSLIANIPKGADLVNAAQLCFKYAVRYQEKTPNSVDVQRAVTKVEKKYIQFSITHILHVNGLAEKKYLEMVSGSVEDLIENLYMDNRILESIEKVNLRCPDINKAVEQLSLLCNIDIEEKRKELLNNWLSIDLVTNSEILSLSNQSSRNYNPISEYLTRAAYLCTSGNVDYWQSYLLSLGNAVENNPKNLGLHAIALKCFCCISNVETIESLTGLLYEDFRKFINKLSLISTLENFGFCLTIEKIDEQNKVELLSRLSYQLNNIVAVKTMASICIIYEIYEANYWRIITTAMVKLKMFQEIKESIIFLKKIVVLYNCQWYIDAWQQAINNAFITTKQCNESSLRSFYVENFFLIQSCPVLLSLNLDFVPKKCFEIEQYDLVILSLQYLKQDLQQFYLKKLKNLDVCVDDKVTQLVNLGFWGATYIKQIVTEFKNNESVLCDT